MTGTVVSRGGPAAPAAPGSTASLESDGARPAPLPPGLNGAGTEQGMILGCELSPPHSLSWPEQVGAQSPTQDACLGLLCCVSSCYIPAQPLPCSKATGRAAKG